jgi:hypothetical protein
MNPRSVADCARGEKDVANTAPETEPARLDFEVLVAGNIFDRNL